MTATHAERVKLRRHSVVYGLLGGTLLYGLMALALRGPHALNYSNGQVSAFLWFGNIKHWPKFFQGFWPLDWLETCVAMGLLMYFLWYLPGTGNENKRKGNSPKVIAKVTAGALVGFGCFGSALMSCLGGWYEGLNGFVMMSLMMAALGGALLLFAGVVIGLGYLISKVAVAAWLKVRATPVGRTLLRADRYLNAKDVQ